MRGEETKECVWRGGDRAELGLVSGWLCEPEGRDHRGGREDHRTDGKVEAVLVGGRHNGAGVEVWSPEGGRKRRTGLEGTEGRETRTEGYARERKSTGSME